MNDQTAKIAAIAAEYRAAAETATDRAERERLTALAVRNESEVIRRNVTGTELVNMDDLKTGDIVRTQGLRVRLGERGESDRGTDTYGKPLPPVIYFRHGEILNPEYLTTDQGRYLFGGIIPLDGSSGWTVQGTGLVQYAREFDAE